VKRLTGLAYLIVCIAAAGCGGGSGKKTGGSGGNAGGAGGGTTGDAAVNSSCTFTACGGDLVGTWHFAASCAVGSSDCPPFTGVTIDSAASVFTSTFTSGGAFTRTTAGMLTETLSYTRACLDAAAGITPNPSNTTGQVCAFFQDAVRSSIGNADAGAISELASFTCSTSGENCVCRQVFMNASQTLTGTYTTNGNQVTVVYTGSDAGTTPTESFDYCVSGDTLKLHFPGTGGSDIVLTYTR
jgi:hypothetical protein